MRARTWAAVLTSVLSVAASACGGTSAGLANTLPPTHTQGCIGPGSTPGSARIAWSELRNPILYLQSSSSKDEAIHLVGTTWHMLFSSITDDPLHWGIGDSASTQMTSWSTPSLWPDQAGTLGVASPDVTQERDGTYVATYTSIPGEVGGAAKIYYRTSRDFRTWSAPRRLAASIHGAPADRLIDPALAFTSHGVILGFKYGETEGQQAFEIAWSPSGSLDGPWSYVGRPDIRVYGDTVENYQFLTIDGRWWMVATSNQLDQPWMFRLEGGPDRPQGWLHWSKGRELQIPSEPWDNGTGITGANYEHANSAYLCDARPVDGHFYLLFSGTPELTTFGGWGHDGIGIARSTDLVQWQVP